mmetsp:Transcript_11709/g.23832  ORF Transcript_11709/g.23832 Transcript_11709/m.23832 type:complete len:118 (-) Transcript_11709:693-1046(-)
MERWSLASVRAGALIRVKAGAWIRNAQVLLQPSVAEIVLDGSNVENPWGDEYEARIGQEQKRQGPGLFSRLARHTDITEDDNPDAAGTEMVFDVDDDALIAAMEDLEQGIRNRTGSD